MECNTNGFKTLWFKAANEIEELMDKEDEIFRTAVDQTFAIRTDQRVRPSQITAEQLDKAVFHLVLPNQVIFEPNDSLSEEERNQIANNLETGLSSKGIPYSKVFSGGKSYHIHIFFNPTTVINFLKELNEGHKHKDYDKVRAYMAGETKTISIMRFFAEYILTQCELDKYLKNLTAYETGAKNEENPNEKVKPLFDLTLFHKNHPVVFPDVFRPDKGKHSKLLYGDLRYYEPEMEELISYALLSVKSKQTKKYIREMRTRVSRPKKFREEIINKKIKVGATEGSRYLESYKLYLLLRYAGKDHNEATASVKEFLLNSEPRGVWDETKADRLSKAKYWNKYYERNSKDTGVVKYIQRASTEQEEEYEEYVKEYLVEFQDLLEKYCINLEKVITNDEIEQYFIFMFDGVKFYVPIPKTLSGSNFEVSMLQHLCRILLDNGVRNQKLVELLDLFNNPKVRLLFTQFYWQFKDGLEIISVELTDEIKKALIDRILNNYREIYPEKVDSTLMLETLEKILNAFNVSEFIDDFAEIRKTKKSKLYLTMQKYYVDKKFTPRYKEILISECLQRLNESYEYDSSLMETAVVKKVDKKTVDSNEIEEIEYYGQEGNQ